MTLRGVFALAVFAILCICHIGSAYEVRCSGRVIQYTDVDSMNAAVFKRAVDALGVVYGTKIDIEHIQSLNDTIVPRMKSAENDLNSHVSTLTKMEKTNLGQIAKKADDLYKRIEKHDLDGFSADIKKAEDILNSITNETKDAVCMCEDAFAVGEGIQTKVAPLREQYQEVYDTLEAFRQKMKEYDSIEKERSAQ